MNERERLTEQRRQQQQDCQRVFCMAAGRRQWHCVHVQQSAMANQLTDSLIQCTLVLSNPENNISALMLLMLLHTITITTTQTTQTHSRSIVTIDDQLSFRQRACIVRVIVRGIGHVRLYE